VAVKARFRRFGGGQGIGRGTGGEVESPAPPLKSRRSSWLHLRISRPARVHSWAVPLHGAIHMGGSPVITSLPAPETPRSAEPTRTWRILVVDDHPVVRTGLGRIYVGEESSKRLLGVMTDPSAGPVGPEHLTNREFEVFRLIGAGMPRREIAPCLCRSIHTVDSHLTRIKRKLNMQTASELTQYAIEWSDGPGVT